MLRTWLVVVAGLAAFGSASAMDILSIQINAGNERTDGVPPIDPYYFDVTVDVTNAASVTVTTPAGCDYPLDQVAPATWWQAGDGFESLAEMRIDPCLGFGDFVFAFVGLDGSQDSVTLSFDPGDSDPFSGYCAISFPGHFDTGISLEPTYLWSCSSAGTCGPAGWDLQVVEGLTGFWRYSAFLDVSETSWFPGALDPQADYWFWCHSTLVYGGDTQSLLTDQGDAFEYAPTFETFNEVTFTTLERIVLTVGRTELSWTFLTGAGGYDVVRGDLGLLLDTGGDFTAATLECLANDHPTTTLPYTDEPVADGEGWWLLARGAVGGTGYESLLSSQTGSRTAEIDLALDACP